MDEIEFQITGIKPYELDCATQYPVLAIRTGYSEALQTMAGISRNTLRTGGTFFNRKYILAKDYYFLTTDRKDNFKWIQPHESNLYKEEPNTVYKTDNRKRLTHYSLEDDIPEDKEMIYPVRPFSITGITLDGFDPGKEYPVLAIDMDNYLPGADEEGSDASEELAAETMTFFLVGDDSGEFVWVGEDSCRLYR